MTAVNVTRGTELAASLEIAGSLWAKFMGLMGRSGLEPGGGLWLPEMAALDCEVLGVDWTVTDRTYGKFAIIRASAPREPCPA